MLTPPDAEKTGALVISTAAPPKRIMSRDPVRSLQSPAPHPEKEDEACTTNPSQISSSRPRLVGGIEVPGVSHHLDTILIAEAQHPASLVTWIPPHTLLGSDQLQNPRDRWK